MVKLRAHYQNVVADEDQWSASVQVYWDEFGNRDAGALRRAFAKAWRQFPDWMPSAGQFEQLVDAMEKTSREPISPDHQLKEEQNTSPDEARARIREIVGNIGTTTEMDADESPPM